MYVRYSFFALFVTSKIVLSSCRSPLAIDDFLTVGSPVSTLCPIIIPCLYCYILCLYFLRYTK